MQAMGFCVGTWSCVTKVVVLESAIGNHRLCSRGHGHAGVGLDASFGGGVGAYNESMLCIYRAP